MRDYKVIIRRVFVFETHTQANTALEASRQVVDLWAVPEASGENMYEELGTMRVHLEDGEITPMAVITEAVDVV